jgi:tRNA1(Val) A37 N6-methylase TrmN6
MTSASDSTRDAFLGGRVYVHQPRHGFRAGTDSVLLAAALPEGFDGQALELGSGAGGALLPAAARLADARFQGFERDPDMRQLCQRGILENGLSERVEVLHGDVGDLPANSENCYDLVFSNPPFFAAGTIEAPGPGKAAAYLESVPLDTWISAMVFATRPKGTLILIHRAAQLAAILAVLDRRAGEIDVMPVRSYPGADAKRVIVRCRKGLRRGPVRLLDGIDVYDAKGGQKTALLEAIARHGHGLDWGRA